MAQTQHLPNSATLHPERRETPRVLALGRLHGHVPGIRVPVHVRELSMGGFSVASARTFEIDDVHDVMLSLRDAKPVTLRSRVVYCRPEPVEHGEPVFVTGFALLDDESAEVVEALGTLIDAVTSTLSFDFD
jgi:hypothetical protein